VGVCTCVRVRFGFLHGLCGVCVERESARECERVREGERECECVCMCVRVCERERMWKRQIDPL